MVILSVLVAICLRSVVRALLLMSRSIGIYAGTFDPVHAGHITFALQAKQIAKLDKVYFLPERRPRDKQHVEHFAHRVAMVKQAIKPHTQFETLELVDTNFSIDRTLPKLQAIFPGDKLVFLFGSDVIKNLPDWPNIDRLVTNYELIVGLRSKDDRESLKRSIEGWAIKPKAVTIFNSYAPDVSSGKVREALRKRLHAPGTLKSVERYSDRNWLYISLAVDKT